MNADFRLEIGDPPSLGSYGATSCGSAFQRRSEAMVDRSLCFGVAGLGSYG